MLSVVKLTAIVLNIGLLGSPLFKWDTLFSCQREHIEEGHRVTPSFSGGGGASYEVVKT